VRARLFPPWILSVAVLAVKRPRARTGLNTWWLIAILLIAAAVRLSWVLLVPNGQYSDSVWYEGAAANLAANGFYGLDGPSAWFPPGYPFFLAVIYKLVGHSEFAGKLGNVAIGIGLTGFTCLLGCRLAGQAVGLLSAALIAVWPNLIFHTGILSSDLLAAFGFAAALWLGMRPAIGRRQTVVLGVFIGWMVLVRPVSLILLASLGIYWWIASRSIVRATTRLLPVVLLVGLVIGGWTIRNYAQFGEVITIATNGGYNFWQTNHRYADGNDTYWPFVPMDDPEYQTMRNGDEFTKNREGYRYALAYLRANPGHLFTMLPTKLFWLYHTDTSGFYEGAFYPPMQGPSPVVAWIDDHQGLVESFSFRYYEVLMALGAIGALLALLRTPPEWIVPILAVPLLLTFFHLFFHAKDRFHMPLAAVIALLAAVAIAESGQLAVRWAGRMRRQAPAMISG
jgi:4-amino-4-deoxy-L-arabinose transferase-like glycosyltransferase